MNRATRATEASSALEGRADSVGDSEEYRIQLDAPVSRALDAVKDAAEAWGAGWEPAIAGGRLTLPTLTGLRRGVQTGRIAVDRVGQGSSVVFRVEKSEHRLNRPATAILLLGALGGICVVLWPFYPPLLGFAPVAVVLAFAAWLLVASRLRHSGPEDFLELVRRLAEGE